jgi:hypothetical protein
MVGGAHVCVILFAPMTEVQRSMTWFSRKALTFIILCTYITPNVTQNGPEMWKVQIEVNLNLHVIYAFPAVIFTTLTSPKILFWTYVENFVHIRIKIYKVCKNCIGNLNYVYRTLLTLLICMLQLLNDITWKSSTPTFPHIKHFIVQLMHTRNKILRLLK